MNMTVDGKYMESMITDHGDDLCHYGVANQKWGQRKYQYTDGRLTPLGRLHYGIGFKNIGQVEAARRAKAKAKKEKEENERIAREESRQREVEKATRSGDAKAIYDLRESMTDQELTRAVARMNATRQLESALRSTEDRKIPNDSKKPLSFIELTKSTMGWNKRRIEAKVQKEAAEKAEKERKAKEAFDKGLQVLDNATKVANSISNAYVAYNKTASIINEIGGDELPEKLPTFSLSPWNKSDNKAKKDKNNLEHNNAEVSAENGDNMNENWMITDGDDCVCHYGVKGMKWHKHLFRKTNSDGSLTIFGKMGKKERQRMSALEQEKTYSDLNRGVGNYDAERAIRRAHDAEKGIKGTESDALAKRRSMDLRRGAANAKTMKAHQDNVNKKARQRKIAQAQANTIKAGQQHVKKMLDKVHKDQRSFKRATANADTMIASAKKRIEKYSNRVVWGLYDTQSKASRIYVTNQKVR